MFSKIKITFIILLASLSQQLAAEEVNDCSVIRLDLSQESMAKIPVYSQENTDICYAILAAEMTDAYRISHGRSPQHLTSVLATAAFYAGKYREALNKSRRDISNDDISMGSFTAAVDTLREKGSCDANKLYNGRYDGIDRKIRSLRSLKKVYSGALKTSTLKQALQISQGLQEIAGNKDLIFTQDQLAEMFIDEAFCKFIDKVFTGVCGPISEALFALPPLVGFSGMRKKNKVQQRQEFYAQLKFAFARSRPQPVAINFCREALLQSSQDKSINRRSA